MTQHVGQLLKGSGIMAGFKVGDIVQLKSGGPAMTVDEDQGTHVWTTWFAGAKREKGRFAVQTLVLIDQDDGKKK
jgi:uncharacterized protein YodC (DUF2158 family)